MLNPIQRSVITGTVMATMLLSGCATSPSFDGPARVVRLAHVDGGTTRQFNCTDGTLTSAATVSPVETNLAYRFSVATCAAYASAEDANAQRRMLETGFTVIQVRCNDFFYQRAGNQMRGRFIRSLISPVGTALTGIVGLINFGGEGTSDDVLAGLTIASSFANSTLTAFEEQFLFSANNVNAVRGLTMRALSTHRAETLTINPATFDQTVRALTDHQMICTPANILEMTRSAIDRGTITPRTDPPVAGAAAAPAAGGAATRPAGEHITLDVGG